MPESATPAVEAEEAPVEAPTPSPQKPKRRAAKAQPKLLVERPEDFDPGIDVLITDSAGCLVRVERPERAE